VVGRFRPALPKSGVVESAEQRSAEMAECRLFGKIWNERVTLRRATI